MRGVGQGRVTGGGMDWVASRQSSASVLAVRGRLDASSSNALETALSAQLEQARNRISTSVLKQLQTAKDRVDRLLAEKKRLESSP